MQIASAMLCEFASVRGGLLTVVSAGITRIWRPVFPAPLNVCVAIVVELESAELEIPHEFAVMIMGPDGQRIAEARGGFLLKAIEREPGENIYAPIALDLRMVGLPQPDAYSAHIYLDSKDVRSLAFWARLGTAPEGI